MWITLGTLALVCVYLIYAYNKLVRRKTMVEEGWSGINVQLKKRHNLIPNLIETVKGYAKHEQTTLDQIVQARNDAQRAEGFASTKAAEEKLSKAMANIFALAEAYPDLKANTNFLQLQEELTDIEEDIEKARRYYNGTVRENNILTNAFPSNIVANAFGFEQVEFFELETAEEKGLPQVKF